jgi:hypothetical protein
MGAAIALLPELYPLIKEGIGDVGHLINYVRSLRSAAQQSGDWTPEAEAQFLAEEIGHAGEHAYKTDAELAK